MKRVARFALLLILFVLIPPVVQSAAPAGDVLTPVAPTAGSLTAMPLAGVQLPADPANARGDWTADADGMIGLIVLLEGEPVVGHLRQLRATVLHSADLDTPQALGYAAELAARQTLFRRALGRAVPQAMVDYQYQTLLNGLSVRLPLDAVGALQALPGVRAVYPDQHYTLQLDAALPLIDAAAYWSTATPQSDAGAGMMIAVIDSGIDQDNPFFDNALLPVPNGYPKGYCVEVDFAFCNNKILVARWYGENGQIPAAATNEVASPADRIGHGTHVAGIAAGNYNQSLTVGTADPVNLSGVAPAAQLLIYKACWRGANCLGSGLLKALEDAVHDGAHVINNSWGGGPGGSPLDNAFRTAIENTVALGIPVVFAAGNDGELGVGSIDCPACVADTIAVANSSTGRLFGNRIAVADAGAPAQLYNLIAYPANGSPQPFPASGIAATTAAQLNPANADGCAAWPSSSLTGRALIVTRGNCSYETKTGHAANAGAFAVIFVEDRPGPPARFSVGTATAIPALLLGQSDGAALAERISAFPQTRLNFDALARHTVSAWADVLARTSSLGPNGDPAVLKPDLSAPGVDILSAYAPFAGGSFAFNSGTSMAAPHVSGAVALLRQRHPDWTPAQIRSALTSTATRSVRQPDGVTMATPFGMGSGRLNLEALARVALTFSASAFTDSACNVCTFEAQMTNVRDTAIGWSAEVDAGPLAVQVDPPSVTLAPGQQVTFRITVDTRQAAAEQWHFAHLTWRDGQTATPDPVLPLAIYAVPDETAAFVKTVSAPQPLYANDVLDYRLRLSNPGTAARSFDVVDALPPNLDYIANSATGGLSYNDMTRTLSATTGPLAPALAISEQDLGGYIDIPTLPQIPCSGVCDNDWFAFGGLDFTYMGERYSDVFVSTNGFIALSEPTGSTFEPHAFPNSRLPNHIIAPLWTDLDLLGDDGDTVGGGKLYAGLVTGAARWYVFEWRNAAHWGNQFNPGAPVRHTFQLWIQEGTPFIWFTYGNLANFGLYPTAIGAEDASGQLGVTRYASGSGAPPSTAFDLRLNSDAGVTYSYRARVTGGWEVVNRARATSGGLQLSAETRTPVGGRLYVPIIRRE